ncbi:MAG: hypothetical protein ACLQUT_02250 [Thermoleophilia bacterium]
MEALIAVRDVLDELMRPVAPFLDFNMRAIQVGKSWREDDMPSDINDRYLQASCARFSSEGSTPALPVL